MVCCTRAARTVSPRRLSRYGAGSVAHPPSSAVAIATNDIPTPVRFMIASLFHLKAARLFLACDARLGIASVPIRLRAFSLALKEILFSRGLHEVVGRHGVIRR